MTGNTDFSLLSCAELFLIHLLLATVGLILDLAVYVIVEIAYKYLNKGEFHCLFSLVGLRYLAFKTAVFALREIIIALTECVSALKALAGLGSLFTGWEDSVHNSDFRIAKLLQYSFYAWQTRYQSAREKAEGFYKLDYEFFCDFPEQEPINEDQVEGTEQGFWSRALEIVSVCIMLHTEAFLLHVLLATLGTIVDVLRYGWKKLMVTPCQKVTAQLSSHSHWLYRYTLGSLAAGCYGLAQGVYCWSFFTVRHALIALGECLNALVGIISPRHSFDKALSERAQAVATKDFIEPATESRDTSTAPHLNYKYPELGLMANMAGRSFEERYKDSVGKVERFCSLNYLPPSSCDINRRGILT